MAEITQKVGFEASQAISSINGLNAALKGLNRSLGTFNARTAESSSSKIIQGFAGAEKAATQARGAVDQTNASLKRIGDRDKDITRTANAMEGLLKALVARFAVQALTNLIASFGEAADAAEEFQLAIARTANIADGPSGTIDSLNDSLKNLSASLGRDLTEVTGSAFEALQNDLGDTDQTLNLLETSANNLALVTGGTLTQAVNSLSSVIKAYNIDISESDRISDIFFGAIDAGRISLEEFQSSLGNVAPLAANLGVSFEQTAASIAAITQSGTTARVAQTQLRNVLQKLIDPTKDLQEAFAALGVATGRELIATTGGLIPALQALSTVAEVGSQEFADFFGTIRGNLGALNLLNNNASDVTRILGELENSANRAAEAAKAIDETDARRSQKAFAELNVTFLELGETTQRIRTLFIELLNGIVSSGDEALAGIAALTTTVGGLSIAAVAAGASLTALSGPIGIIALGAAGIAITTAKLVELGRESLDVAGKISRANEELKEFNKRQADVQASKQATLLKEAIEETSESFKTLVDNANKNYSLVADAAEGAQKRILQISDNTVKDFIGSVKGITSELKKLFQDASDTAQDFRDNATSIRQELSDFKFEEGLRGLTDQQKATERLLQLNRELKKLRDIANQATLDPESQQAVQDQQRRVTDALRDASREKAFEKDVASRKKLAAITEETLKQQAKAEEQVAKNIDTIKERFNKGRFDKEVQRQQQLAEIASRAEGLDPTSDAAKKLQEEFNDVAKRVDFDLLEAAGLDQQLENLVNNFGKRMNELRVDFTGINDRLQAVLNERVFKAVVDLQISDTGSASLDKALKQAITDNPGETLSRQVKIAQEFIASQEDARIKFQKLSADIETDSATIATALDKAFQLRPILSAFSDNAAGIRKTLAVLKESISSATPETQSALTDQINQAAAQVEALKKSGDITVGQAEVLLEAIKAERSLLESSVQKNSLDIIEPEAIQAAKDGLTEIGEAAAKADLGVDFKLDKAAQDANQTSTNLNNAAINASSASANIGVMKTNADNTKTSTDSITTAMTGVVSQTGAAIGQMNALAEAAARAAANVAAATSGGGAGFAFSGKKIPYRAAGGDFLRGQDRQLVSVAPGERIINARQNRNFNAELQAMNAGQSPQFRDKGGPVTNIGDVHVSVSSPSSAPPDQVGRGIASGIRRELRRKTSQL